MTLRTMIVAGLLALAAGSAWAQTLTFTAETVTGVESVVPKLTWSTTPAAVSCTASGASDWTGSKPSQGTATLVAITSSRTYTLSCTWPGDTTAELTWVAPTTNTDGSALTNLAGFKLYRGNSATNVRQGEVRTVAQSAATSASWTGLVSGTHYFCVTAYNVFTTESDCSNVAQKTISASPSANRTVAIAVNPRPSAPTELTVH